MLNAAVLIILSCCWLIPEHLPPWYAFHTETPAFVASIVGLVACVWRAPPSMRIPNGFAWSAVLLASVFVQWTTGRVVYGGDAWVATTYLLVFTFAWLWAYQWSLSEESSEVLTAISLFLVFVGLATAFQIFLQWLQVTQLFAGWVLDPLPNGRPRANLGQPNQAATTLVMAMVASALLCARNRIGYGVCWLLVLVLVAAAALTQSRTALLSTVVVALSFLTFTYGSTVGLRDKFFVALWLLLFLGAAWAFSNVDLGNQSAALKSEQFTTAGTRPLIWRQLSLAVMERPWLGWGWLQLASAHQFGGITFPGVEQATYAHDIVLDSLVMLGIPTTVLLVLMALKWLAGRWQLMSLSPEARWSVALLSPVLIHSMLEYPHAYSYYLMLAGILVGVMDASTQRVNARIMLLSKQAMTAIAAVWVLVLAAMGYEYFQAEEDFRVNRFENRRIGPPIVDYMPPHLIFLTQLGEQARAMRLRAVRGMPAEDVNLLHRVAKRYSWGPIEFRAALALGLNGQPEAATERLRVIKSIFAEDIYEEARENFQRLGNEKYPELQSVAMP